MDNKYELDKNPDFSLAEMRRRKKLKKKQIRIKRIKRAVLFLLFLTVVIGTALSPLFKIVKLEVNSLEHCNGDDVTASVGDFSEKNGFEVVLKNNSYMGKNNRVNFFGSRNSVIKLRLGLIEDKLIQEYPYIKSVSVRFVIPSTIKVEIIEKQPYAVIPYNDKFVLIDEGGVVLETLNGNSKGYIQLNGIQNTKGEVGQAAFEKSSEVMPIVKNFLTLVNQSDESENNKIMPLISSINVADIYKIKIYVDKRLVTVLGDVRDEESAKYKINFLRQLFYKNISKTERGILDFTMGENPRFIPN